VVDGFFVSNFAGKEPFTAVNFRHADHHDPRLLRLYVRQQAAAPSSPRLSGKVTEGKGEQAVFHAGLGFGDLRNPGRRDRIPSDPSDPYRCSAPKARF
jgi:hypothetical protein